MKKINRCATIITFIFVLLLFPACSGMEDAVDETIISDTHVLSPPEQQDGYLQYAEDENALPEQLEIVEEDIVDIGERFFATRINDILLNSFERYLGRPIRYEGMFWSVYLDWMGRYYHYVIRYTDGCCGPHETSVGFEVYLGDIAPVAEGEWVEVLGILERTIDDGISHVRLRVVSLVLLETPGIAFVPN